jgi:hypothetical protein
MSQEVLDEALDCGQATVAGVDTIASGRLQVVKKCQDHFGSDIIEAEVRHGTANVLGQEQEEHSKSITISAYAVSAGSTGTAEIGSEVALHQSEQHVSAILLHDFRLPPV